MPPNAIGALIDKAEPPPFGSHLIRVLWLKSVRIAPILIGGVKFSRADFVARVYLTALLYEGAFGVILQFVLGADTVALFHAAPTAAAEHGVMVHEVVEDT